MLGRLQTMYQQGNKQVAKTPMWACVKAKDSIFDTCNFDNAKHSTVLPETLFTRFNCSVHEAA